MAHRGAQLDRALPHECCADRPFLRERGMGEAAATGRRGFREAASRRPIQIARRQALSRRRPLHGWRSHDDDGAAHPQAHRHRHQRQAPRRLYRPLHGTARLQARPRCTGRRLQGSGVAAWPRRTSGNGWLITVIRLARGTNWCSTRRSLTSREAQRVEDAGKNRWRCYALNFTTFWRCSPSPSIPSVTTSPALRNFGSGFMPSPTPGGVPVVMTSPGSSTKNCEQYQTRCLQSKIMVLVLPRWRLSPLTSSHMSRRCGSLISSLVTSHGPMGPKLSELLPLIHCPLRSIWNTRSDTSFARQ